MSIAGQLVFSALLLVVAAFCLFFPRRIQAFAIRTAKFDAIRSFVQSGEYVLMVRAGGIVALLMGLTVIWLTFWGSAD